MQPIVAGSRLCVAAATSDRLLTWSDSTDIPMAPALRVDLGAPVQSMGLINEATLRVVCADGRVVLLNPPLVAGETLRGIAAVTDSPPAPPGIKSFLQLFRRSVEGFSQAANLLVEARSARAFEPGLAAARDAASLLAQAFNTGELALKSNASDGNI